VATRAGRARRTLSLGSILLALLFSLLPAQHFRVVNGVDREVEIVGH
jgi:hypothetical protein